MTRTPALTTRRADHSAADTASSSSARGADGHRQQAVDAAVAVLVTRRGYSPYRAQGRLIDAACRTGGTVTDAADRVLLRHHCHHPAAARAPRLTEWAPLTGPGR